MENGSTEIVELRAQLAAALARADAAEADLARERAKASSTEALIASLKLHIEKLRRELYGQRSERKQRLLEQYEFELEELEAKATEDELAAEDAAAKTTSVQAFERRRPARRPFPEHLPRERRVEPAPECCEACGADKLVKLGETITETLESVPRQWKVIQTVREKFSCRCCEHITQPPAPFHPVPRAWAGPSLLAMILYEKFGNHQPLNRQSERYALEGVELSVSTLADQVGACAHALKPLHDLIAEHVLAAERLHGDDTTVPVLARGKTVTGRAWVYVRDDAPFGGAKPAALFKCSRHRRGEHPAEHLKDFTGVLQADAYGGYNELYAAGAIKPAFCWAHGRRKFYELADIAKTAKRGKPAPPISPLALAAVKRIDAVFDIERAINGRPPDERLAVRQETVRPLVDDLEVWLRENRAGLSRHDDVARAMDYMLKRWTGFSAFLEDGRICLTNNAAERALRGLALGRKSWLFAGSDRGGRRAAVIYTLIFTAKMNGIDPQAWLAEVLARIAGLPQARLHELLPWNWKAARQPAQAA
ncbi:IS66 family transposase [Ferruginivarius sediminum]|uniref:IS66 family transposase n=1 Tax=Ferruginivarius sediminum TaxID=2661937 RepID=A0A369T4A7_9PROT|nr:IS66 family transposase [Ferruginivarius sediminum]RDD60180.1 IS66 family transposase [Ferruginivarius sediminum]